LGWTGGENVANHQRNGERLHRLFIACLSLVYERGLAASMAGNTTFECGWTRFQKTADLNPGPPCSNDTTAEGLKGALLSQVCPVSKG
jgi:hypothetical protein